MLFLYCYCPKIYKTADKTKYSSSSIMLELWDIRIEHNLDIFANMSSVMAADIVIARYI